MADPSQETRTLTLDTEVNGIEIVVEFSQPSGLRQVSITPENVVQKSAEAVDKAMGMVKKMAHKGIVTLDNLARKPTQIEMEFGIKFTAETGAIIAKTAAEASLMVKLTWERNNDESNKSSVS